MYSSDYRWVKLILSETMRPTVFTLLWNFKLHGNNMFSDYEFYKPITKEKTLRLETSFKYNLVKYLKKHGLDCYHVWLNADDYILLDNSQTQFASCHLHFEISKSQT